MGKKTLKFNSEEEHIDFEKTRVQPTKLFDVDELDFNKEQNFNPIFNEMSTDDLVYKLEYDDLTDEEIFQIKAILRSRE